MRLTVLTALSLGLVAAGCDTPDPAANASNQSVGASPAVSAAIVQLPAVPGRPGAAYFRIDAGKHTLTIGSAKSDKIERIEFHESRVDGNITRMVSLPEIVVESGSSVVFEPGGRHAMLFGIDPSLKAGDKVKLSFQVTLPSFYEGPHPDLEVEAEVRAFGGGHGGH